MRFGRKRDDDRSHGADPCREEASDEQLVAMSRAGDDVALTMLLDRYRGFARA